MAFATLLLKIILLPLFVEGFCTIDVQSVFIYTESGELSLQNVQSQTATFNLLWFGANVSEISCPTAVVGAAVTANIDGTGYMAETLSQFPLGNGVVDYGAPMTDVVLDLANPSHTAIVTWIFLSTNNALYPGSVVASTVFGVSVIGSSVAFISEPVVITPTTSSTPPTVTPSPSSPSSLSTAQSSNPPSASLSQASSTSPPTQSPSSSRQLSSGAIAAIATSISAVFIVAILAGTFAWYKLKIRADGNAPTGEVQMRSSMNQHNSTWKDTEEKGQPMEAVDTAHERVTQTSGRLQYPDAEIMESGRIAG